MATKATKDKPRRKARRSAGYVPQTPETPRVQYDIHDVAFPAAFPGTPAPIFERITPEPANSLYGGAAALPLAPEPDFYDRTHAFFGHVQAEFHKELDTYNTREDLAPLTCMMHAIEEYLLSRNP
jgi:hypothetical protein